MTDPAIGKTLPENPPELAYQSLYRRYRPQQFAEVRGQDHVTRALRNAVASSRVSHAYLFSGPRGTGKTSTARILAKALNCTAPVDGEPCGVCESCTSIAAGTSFDVHELDAASNNGVAEMRDLVARASLYSPGRSKVYIIDEAHMLSTGASNALLKTLEEPPEHVVFVLATTDPQKMLPTIRSRTQHFEFHLLGEDVLQSLLAQVATDAALDLPDGALDLARHRGQGLARDALSVLDQVAAAGVVEDDVDEIAALARSLGANDTTSALAALAAAARAGRDPHQIAIELVERLRAGFLGLVAPGAPATEGPDMPGALDEARALGPVRCVRAMELVGGAIVAMRDAPEPRVTLEVALIRLTHPEVEDSPEAMLDRIERLERKLEALGGPIGSPLPEHVAAPIVTPVPAGSAPPRPTAPPHAPVPARPPLAVETDATESDLAAPVEPDLATQSPTPAARPLTPGGTTARPALGAFTTRPPSPDPASEAERTVPDAARGTALQHPDPTTPPSADTEIEPAPSRDELVAAWGDHVLLGLRPSVKMIYAAGRFVESDGPEAHFALPNAPHVARAEVLRGEVLDALVKHVGRPFELRLVVDRSWDGGEQPTTARRPAPPAQPSAVSSMDPGEDPFPDEPPTAGPPPEEDNIDQIAIDGGGEEDPKLGITWAKDRLLEAFPGAEEVNGQ